MLDYRLRRWPNIDTTLGQRVSWLASANALYNITITITKIYIAPKLK